MNQKFSVSSDGGEGAEIAHDREVAKGRGEGADFFFSFNSQ
jgi:hypothetical protein